MGTLLNMGIVFAGLQIGFTIVGSTVAAVLGFGLLRGILRKGSILEVNIFQTVASSVNTVNAFLKVCGLTKKSKFILSLHL